MLIKHAKFEIEIDHKGFLYLGEDPLGSDLEAIYLEWPQLTAEEEVEVLAIRAATKALLDRGKALYSKVSGRLKN